MAIDLHIAPDPLDPAIRADQNRCAKNAMEGLAIHGFFAPDAVSLQHLVLLVRCKRSGELMLVSKGFLRLWGIGRNAEYGGLTFRKCARQSGEIDGLLCAARRVRARIEKQHELAPRIVRQRDGVAAVAWQSEGRRLCTLRQSRFAGGRSASFSTRRFL